MRDFSQGNAVAQTTPHPHTRGEDMCEVNCPDVMNPELTVGGGELWLYRVGLPLRLSRGRGPDGMMMGFRDFSVPREISSLMLTKKYLRSNNLVYREVQVS